MVMKGNVEINFTITLDEQNTTVLQLLILQDFSWAITYSMDLVGVLTMGALAQSAQRSTGLPCVVSSVCLAQDIKSYMLFVSQASY